MAETVGELLVKISGDIAGLRGATENAERLLKRMAGATEAPTKGFTTLQASVISLNQGLGLLERGVRSAESLGSAFFEQADSANILAARIRLVTTSQEEAISIQTRLIALSQASRTDLVANVELYARLARSTGDLKLSQEELLTITDTINKALLLGGATASEAASAVLQLSQAFQSGRLQGDELRAIIETPLGRVFADSLGVSIGRLRELASQSAITGDILAKALLGSSSQINAQFARIPVTASQAFQTLRNAALVAVGEIDSATGATQALVGAIDRIRRSANANLPALVAQLRSAADSARDFADATAENRTAVFTGLEIAVAGAAAAFGVLAVRSLGAGAALNLAFAHPIGAVLVTGATAATIFAGKLLDLQRETDATDEVFGRLAIATAHARARGQELTSAQRAAILAGKSLADVYALTAQNATATGDAATAATGKIDLAAAAMKRAAAESEILGTALGKVPQATATAFPTLAATIGSTAAAMQPLSTEAKRLQGELVALAKEGKTSGDQFKTMAERLKLLKDNSKVNVTVAIDQLKAGITSVNAEIARGVNPIRVKADEDSLRAAADAIKQVINQAVPDEGLKFELVAQIDAALGKINEAHEKAKKPESFKVDADTAEAEEEIDRLKAKAAAAADEIKARVAGSGVGSGTPELGGTTPFGGITISAAGAGPEEILAAAQQLKREFTSAMKSGSLDAARTIAASADLFARQFAGSFEQLAKFSRNSPNSGAELNLQALGIARQIASFLTGIDSPLREPSLGAQNDFLSLRTGVDRTNDLLSESNDLARSNLDATRDVSSSLSLGNIHTALQEKVRAATGIRGAV